MAFFKKYNGSTDIKLIRMERLVWVLIYGGLVVAVIGHFTAEADEALGQGLGIAGLIAVAAGALLIYARSRLHEGDEEKK